MLGSVACVVNEWWIRAQVLLSMPWDKSVEEEELLEKNFDPDEIMRVQAFWCFEGRYEDPDDHEDKLNESHENFERFIESKRRRTLRIIFTVMAKQVEICHFLEELGI